MLMMMIIVFPHDHRTVSVPKIWMNIKIQAT